MLKAHTVTLRGGLHAIIAPATEEDAAALLAYLDLVAGETDFLAFDRGEVGLTLEQEAAFVRRLHAEDGGVMLKATIDGELAAVASLLRLSRSRVRHSATLGLSVQKRYWALGLGRAISEALILEARRLHLTRIELRVRNDNARAISLYETLGFQHEGTLRQAFMVDGVAHDDWLMGLLLRHDAHSASQST
jgi:RimJ/RimL family protein N-acetyltransferase